MTILRGAAELCHRLSHPSNRMYSCLAHSFFNLRPDQWGNFPTCTLSGVVLMPFYALVKRRILRHGMFSVPVFIHVYGV